MPRLSELLERAVGEVRSDLDPTDAPAESDRTVTVAAKTVSGSITVTRST
jgi:hypothetical protein